MDRRQIKARLEPLLKKLPFHDPCLLNQALTHSSYVYENPDQGEDNEQLEFIGDALLNFLSADYIFKHLPELTEGQMTVLRSNLVDTNQLAQFAKILNLGTWMLLGKGEDKSGGRKKSSLLSNVFEAVIGAYYLDSGIETVRSFLYPLFENIIKDLTISQDEIPKIHEDVKGLLQKIVLDPAFPKNPDRLPPEYKTERLTGPDNNPVFTSTVYVANAKYGIGQGRSKKEAEKRAAEDALKRSGLI